MSNEKEVARSPAERPSLLTASSAISLSLEWFRSRAEPKVLIEFWRNQFSEVRQHSSLDDMTSGEFVASIATNAAPVKAMERTAAVREASALRSVAQPLRQGQAQKAEVAAYSNQLWSEEARSVKDVAMERESQIARANIGCGKTPTKGWRNYDNSMSVRLARKPVMCFALRYLGCLNRDNIRFIAFVKENDIRWANAARCIPERDASLDALYSSHVIEHLYPAEARSFLAEAFRVLKPGGVIRIAISDLRFHIDSYLAHGDADLFVDHMMLATPQPRGVIDRMRIWVVGHRHQMWKYDGASLARLLESEGFRSARTMPAGETLIADPGPLNLAERAPESVFVEAIRP